MRTNECYCGAKPGPHSDCEDPRADDYPVSVTFRFRTQEEKSAFLGGLSDGWGENECSLDWCWRDAEPGDLYSAEWVAVTPFDDEETGS